MDIKHQTQTNGHVRIAGQIKIIGDRILNGRKPGEQQIRVGGNIVEKALGVRGHGVGQHDFFSAADCEQEQPFCNVVIIELQIFFIFKLGHDLTVVNDGTYNQLREECDEQQIVNDIILFCFSPVGVHQKCDQLERKERNTDRQCDMFQRIVAAGQQVVIFNKEIGVLIVAEQSDVAGKADGQQQLTLNPLIALHPGHGSADDVVADHASEKEREEGRAALRIEIKGGGDQPDFGDRILPEMV